MAPQLRAFGHHLDELAPRITDVELAKGRAMEGGSLGLRVDDQVRLVTTRSSGWLVALAAGALVIVLVGSVAWWFGSDGTAEPAGPVVPPPVTVDPAAPVVPLPVGVVVGTLPISGYFYGYGSSLVDGAVWIPARGRARGRR